MQMISLKTIELRGRLSGQQKTRLQNLLDMMYRPSELAEEIGFEKRQIYRVYLHLGLPHERDHRNHVWINGISFRKWILDYYPKQKLKENEAFCLTCKHPVEIENPSHKKKTGLVYLECNCPICGRKISKIIDRKV